MASFSWSDTARAVFGSCLHCFPSPQRQDIHEVEHVTRRDELESLLQGADFTDTELDADALSLHSNIGQHDGRKRVKKKRTKNKGSISLFGFELFGRPLADSEAGDAEDGYPTHHRASRISSSTLDSDAAPIADDTIAQLSLQTHSGSTDDEERKARKRLRKQLKAAALLSTQGDAFEGFQGSGALAPPTDDFGAFQQASHPRDPEENEFVNVPGGGSDETYGDADADFDAASYVRTAEPRSDSGSGTRSRTSASNTLAHLVPLPPSSSGSQSSNTTPNHPLSKPKRSKKSGKQSSTTASSPTNSQPRSPTTLAPAPHVTIASPNAMDEGIPRGDTFEGVPQDDLGFPAVRRVKRGLKLTGESVHGDQERSFPSPGLSSTRGFPSPGLGGGGFPSPGLGRSGGFPSPGLGGRKNSLSTGGHGAFLARTGEDP